MSAGSSNPYASPTSPTTGPGFAGDTVGQLATRSQRFLGALIDGLILLPFLFIAGAAMGMILVLAGVDAEGFIFQVIAALGGLVLNTIIFLAINGYFLATRGQTIGKIVMKTRIVDEQGSLVPFPQLFLKRYFILWILASIPFVGSVIALIDSLCIFRSSYKCLHDDIAATKVIQIAV